MATLSESIIKKTPAPATGQAIYYDDHKDAPRGFGLRITAAGTRAFILRYKSGGRDRRMTIGEWPTWSTTAARKQASTFKREIDTGTDILETRRRAAEAPTVGAVIESYCVSYVDKLKTGPAVRSSLERHLRPIAKRKLSDIKRRDIISLVEVLAGQHGRTAALLLIYVKGLFAWAEDRELIDANPAATIKPGKISKKMSPVKRGRVLSDAELCGLWGDISGIHRLTLLVLRLVLITGQRPGEVAGMRWDEVDGQVWTIPGARRGKTGTDHAVPLTAQAQDILDRARAEAARLAPRRKSKAGGFVFEARPGAPITVAALGRAVARYADDLQNKAVEPWGHWTPHDLRRTCRTGLAALSVYDTVAEQVVGHVRRGIEGNYDLHSYDREKRTALESWERRLKGIITGQPVDANVVNLRAG